MLAESLPIRVLHSKDLQELCDTACVKAASPELSVQMILHHRITLCAQPLILCVEASCLNEALVSAKLFSLHMFLSHFGPSMCQSHKACPQNWHTFI